ncbi:MAG: TdeIII family type II restriction endonuclease [Ignavibacterium sp.]
MIVLVLRQHLKSKKEFWDFLGGQGTYTELLGIFERIGLELRPEIDAYFAKYNKQ